MTTTNETLGCRVVIDSDDFRTVRCGDNDADGEALGYMPFLCRSCFAATKPRHAESCSVGYGGDCTCGATEVISDGGRCQDEVR